MKTKVVVIILSANIQSIWSTAWPILLAILFFGFIILIHELGHFTFAKLFKVKVNEFSIGMGPAIFKKKMGETEYALRAIPMGGYVAMEGEDEESNDPRSFNSQTPFKKAVILAAGGVMNLILGIVIMAVILSKGLIGTPMVANFVDNASSSNYGLMAGDKIVSINGNKIFSEYDLSFYMSRDEDAVLDMTVERNNEKTVLRHVKFDTTEYNGKDIIKYDFAIVGLEPTFKNVMKYSFLESGSIARIVWVSLIDIVTLNFDMDDLAGPIGTVGIIADTAKDAEAETDYSGLFTIMAFITINIGVFNLLPVPALDGGRLFFVMIEGIRRKPISPKYEGFVHSLGFALLIGLMLLVTFNDIVNLFK